MDRMFSLDKWSHPERQGPRRALAVLLVLAFTWPEVAWAFDRRTLTPSTQDRFEVPARIGRIITQYGSSSSQPHIFLIQDLHASYEAQSKIRVMVERLAREQGVSLLALEGSSGDLDAGPLARLPYPRIKERIYDHFLHTGRLSGAEVTALVGGTGVRLFGAEDPEEYAGSVALARSFLGQDVQTRFQSLRAGYEELSDALLGEDLLRLDEKHFEFLDGRLAGPDYAEFLRREAADRGLDLRAAPELTALADPRSDLDPVQRERILWPVLQDLRARLYTDPSQGELDARRRDLDVLERVLNVAAYPEDLEDVLHRPDDFRVERFLSFYREQAAACRLGTASDPGLTELEAHAQAALRFYTLAQRRNTSLVDNTLRRLRELGQDRAVLIAGGFHTAGLSAVLRARGVAHTTLSPTLTEHSDPSPYYARLMGEPGPFERLTRPSARFLALPSALLRGPEQQEFWQEFTALYLGAVAPGLAQGRTQNEFLAALAPLLAELNRGSPYPVNVDEDRLAEVWGRPLVLLPLIVRDQERTVAVTLSTRALPARKPFFSTPAVRVFGYEITADPALAAAVRRRPGVLLERWTTAGWQAMTGWVRSTRAVLTPGAVRADRTRSRATGPAELRLPLTRRLGLLAAALGRTLLANPRTAFGLLFAILGIGATLATGNAGLLATVATLSIGGEALPDRLNEIETRLAVPVIEHPLNTEGSYIEEASHNLHALLEALNVPQGAVVVNVGSGRNPLTVPGYLVVNTDTVDMRPSRGTETFVRANFFAPDFREQVRAQTGIASAPDVVLFFNMGVFMTLYGPFPGPDLELRRILNTDAYLQRALEVVRPGGRVLSFEFMPPWAPGALDTRDALSLFDRILHRAPGVVSRVLLRRTADGRPVAVAHRTRGPDTVAGDAAQTSGAILVSAGKAMLAALAAVTLGALFSFSLGSAAVLTVSLWGAGAGFALGLNYLPRAYYAWRLLAWTGPRLSRENVDTELGETLEEVLTDLRRRGGIGDDYLRPRLEVLRPQPAGSLLWRGLWVARGTGGSGGNLISVHPSFLALPPLLRRMILEHEVLESVGAGHWRATLAEYRAYVRARLVPAVGAMQSLGLFLGVVAMLGLAVFMPTPTLLAALSFLVLAIGVWVVLYAIAYPGIYPAALATLVTWSLAPLQRELEHLLIRSGRSRNLTFGLTLAQRTVAWLQTRSTALPEYQIARVVMRQYLRRSAPDQALHLPLFEQVYAEMRYQLGAQYDPARGEQAILRLQDLDLPRWLARRPERAERLRGLLLRQAGAYFRRVGGFAGGRALNPVHREEAFSASLAAVSVLARRGDEQALTGLIGEARRWRREHRTATALPEMLARQRLAVNRENDLVHAEELQTEITEQREAIRRWTNLHLMLQQAIAGLGSGPNASPGAREQAAAYLHEVVQDHTASGEGFYWLREQAAYRLRDFDTPETRRVLAELPSLPLDPRTCMMEDVAAADPNIVSLELAAAESVAFMERTRARTRALARDLQGLERAEHRVQHLQGIADALTSPAAGPETVVFILRWLTQQSRELTYAANLLLPVLEALSLGESAPYFSAASQRALLKDRTVQLAAQRAFLQVARTAGLHQLKGLPAAHPLRRQFDQAVQRLDLQVHDNRHQAKAVEAVRQRVHALLGNAHRLAELTGFDDPRLSSTTPKVVALTGVTTAESLLAAAGTLLEEPLAVVYSAGYNGSHDGWARGRSLAGARVDLPSLGAAARLLTLAAFQDGGPLSVLLDRMLGEVLNAEPGSCLPEWEALSARYARDAAAAGVGPGFEALALQVRPLLERADADRLPVARLPLRHILLHAWLSVAGGIGPDLMNPDGIEAGFEAFARMLGTDSRAMPAGPFGEEWVVRTAAGQELIGENCISYMPRAPITGAIRPGARIAALERYHPPTPFASRTARLVRNATVVISGLASRWATSFATFLLDPALMLALAGNAQATRVLLANPVHDSEFYGQSFGDVLAFVTQVTRRPVSGLWNAILASRPTDLDAPYKPHQPQKGTLGDVLWLARLGFFGTGQIPEYQGWSLASQGVEVLDREGLVEVVREPSRADPSRKLPVVRYVPELLAAALWRLVPDPGRRKLRLTPIVAFLQRAQDLETRLAAEGLSWSALGLTSPLDLQFFPELAFDLREWFEGRSALPRELVPRRAGESQFQSQVRAALEACQADFAGRTPRFLPLPLSGRDLVLDAPIPLAQFRLDDATYDVLVRLRTAGPRAGLLDLPPPAEPATRLGRMALENGGILIEVPAEVLRLGETPAERARYLQTAVAYHLFGLTAAKSRIRLTPKRSPQGEAERVTFLHEAGRSRLAKLDQRVGAASPRERLDQLLLFLPAVSRIREAARAGKTVVFITDRDGTVTLHQKPMSAVELRRYAAPLPRTMVKAILTGSRFPAVFSQLIVPLLRRQYRLEMLSDVTGLPAQTPGLQPDTLSNLLFGILSGMNVFGRKGSRKLEQVQQRYMDPTTADLVEMALYATMPVDPDASAGRQGRQVERRFPYIRPEGNGYTIMGHTTIACVATGLDATAEANRAYDPSQVRRTLQGAIVSLLLAHPNEFYAHLREWVTEDPPVWRISVQGDDARPIEVVVSEAQKPQIRRIFRDLAARTAQEPELEGRLTRLAPITVSVQPWSDANLDFTVGSKNEGVTTILTTLGLDPERTFVVYAGDEARLKWIRHGEQRVLSEGNDYAVTLNPDVDLVLYNGPLGPDIVLGPRTIAAPGGVAPELLNALFSFTTLDHLQGQAAETVRRDADRLGRTLAQRGLTWAQFGVTDPREINEAQARDVLARLEGAGDQAAFPGPGATSAGSRRSGDLRVSPLRAALLALGAVGTGWVFGFVLGPAALTSVSVWGAVSGLGLVLNYAPRLYYLYRLSRPHAPPLTSATADAQLAGVFEALEAQGGLPAGYRRPTIEVLTDRSPRSRGGQRVLVGHGETREDGPVVSLHANFLSLPTVVQLAILRHEVFEADGRGHWRATLAEYGSYLRLGARPADRAAAPAGGDRTSRVRRVLVTAGYASLGLLGAAASVSALVIFATGALPWSLGLFLSAAAAWLFAVALGPLLEPAPGPAREGSGAGLTRRGFLGFLGLAALTVWGAVLVSRWWSGPAFATWAPTSGEIRDLAELDRRRREAFQAWERRPGSDLLQTYLDLCRQEQLALIGPARTPELVRALGLSGKAAEIFLRYGVISEGADEHRLGWTEAVLLAYPESFTARTRFITWSPAVAANAWRWEAPALLLPRDGEPDFRSQTARLLGPIWDAEPANSTVRASFLARYGQAARASFLQVYGERLDALLDLPWTSARLIPVSSFAGGHWVLRVRDAWISVVGEFTRAQLKAVQTAYQGVPANHLDGFRLVQELRSTKPGLAGQQFGDVIDLRDTGSRSRVQPFIRLAHAIGSVTNQVETHELAHYVHGRLSPFLREVWTALHEAGSAREHCVSQYAFDAKGESWVGNPVMEDFAESYTVFKEELARGNVALDGLSAPLREKLRFMAGLFVVAEPAPAPRMRPGTLHVNGRSYPVTLDEDGSLSESSFRVWAQERLKERLEAGIELQDEPDWDLLESLAATGPALDPGRPVLHSKDLARVLDQRTAHPRTYAWLTGLDPSDAAAAERLHLGLARLAADLRVDPAEVQVPAGLLLGLAEPPAAGAPWQRITAASARWFIRGVRANGPDEYGEAKWDLDIGYGADPEVRETFSDLELYALEEWTAANAVTRPGALRRVEPFEDAVALARAEERVVERLRYQEAGAADELERIMVSYYTIRHEDMRNFPALDEAGHRRLIALLRRAPGLSVDYLVRTFRSFADKGWLNAPLLFRGYYGEDAYRALLQDPDQAAVFVSLVVECGNQETWSLKRVLDLAAETPDPVRGLSAILAGLAIAKRLGLAPTLADMIVGGDFPGVTAQNRTDLLAAFLNQVPESQGLDWLDAYLEQGLFTPQELEELRTLGMKCGFAVQSRMIGYLGTLRTENDAVISVAPVRPFDWRGSLRTAAFFLASGLGSVALALAVGPAAPLLLGGLVLQPGLALLTGASAFGAAGFLVLALDVRGNRFWEFLARRGRVRAGPDRLLAEFRDALPAEPGAPAPVYTRGTVLYADREFLAQRPRWLQRVYLGHERWHAAFPGRGEVFAFGPQAAPLVLAQVLGLSLALGVVPGVAAIFGAAALAAAAANVLQTARPAVRARAAGSGLGPFQRRAPDAPGIATAAASSRPGLARALFFAGRGAMGLLALLTAAGSIAIFVTGALPWSLGIFLAVAAPWFYLESIAPFTAARKDAGPVSSRRRSVLLTLMMGAGGWVGISLLPQWARRRIWMAVRLPGSGARDLVDLHQARREAFQAWEAGPTEARFQAYQSLCIEEAARLRPLSRTRELADLLELRGAARSLFLRYGVVLEGERGDESRWTEALLASLPEVFVQDTRFLAWTPTELPQGSLWGQATLVFQHTTAEGFRSGAERLLEPMWEREPGTGSLRTSFLARYGLNAREDFLTIYRERVRLILTRFDARAYLHRASGFSEGHWILRVRDNWISIIGPFRRTQLRDIRKNFLAVPANHLDGFRLVQELRPRPGLAGLQYADVIELEKVGRESRITPFLRLADMEINVTEQVAVHELGHYVHHRLSTDLRDRWTALHRAGRARTDCVSRYAFDAQGTSWQGDPEKEDFAETYTVFKEDLAQGHFWLESVSPALQEKLRFMAGLFVVRETAEDGTEASGHIFLNGRRFPVRLEPDGTLSPEAFRDWVALRVKEHLETGVPLPRNPDWDLLEGIVATQTVRLDQDRAICSLADLDTLLDLRTTHPACFTWFTGLDPQDQRSVAAIRAAGEELRRLISAENLPAAEDAPVQGTRTNAAVLPPNTPVEAVWLPLSVLRTLPDGGPTAVQVGAVLNAIRPYALTTLRLDAEPRETGARWTLTTAYVYMREITRTLAGRWPVQEIMSWLQEYAAPGRTPQLSISRYDPEEIAAWERELVRLLQERSPAAGEVFERLKVSFHQPQKDLRLARTSKEALYEDGHLRLQALLAEVPDLPFGYLAGMLARVRSKQGLELDRIVREYYGRQGYRRLLTDPAQAAQLTELIVADGYTATPDQRLLVMIGESERPDVTLSGVMLSLVSGRKKGLAWLMGEKLAAALYPDTTLVSELRLGIARLPDDPVQPGRVPERAEGARRGLFETYLRGLPGEMAGAWLREHLRTQLYTPAELNAVEAVAARIGPELHAIFTEHLEAESEEAGTVLSLAPVRPFDWRGSLRTAAFFLATGLGSVALALALGPAAPLLLGGLVLQPGLALLTGASAFGAAGFLALALDVRGNRFWAFLARRGRVRAGPDRLLAEFRDALPAEPGAPAPVYTRGTVLYADREFLAQRPRWLQRVYLGHERWHAAFPGRGEVFAFGPQAAPLVLAQVLGLSLALGVVPGVAAVFGAAALAAAAANVLRTARPAARERLRALAATLGQFWTRTWTYARAHPVQSALLALALTSPLAGQSAPVLAVVLGWTASEPEDRGREISSSPDEPAFSGETVILRPGRERALPVREALGALGSLWTSRAVSGAASLEARWEEISVQDRSEVLNRLIGRISHENRRIKYSAWLALRGIARLLPEGAERDRIEQELDWKESIGRVQVGTGPGRLTRVHDLILTYPPLRALLERPEGCVVQDVGLGGPEPVTTAELATRLRPFGSRVRVVGSDLMVPALRLDGPDRSFAYFDGAGRFIGAYDKVGAPLTGPNEDGKWLDRLAAAREGAPGAQARITERPLHAYARRYGFELVTGAFGAGVKSDLMIFANVLYLYSGREEETLARLTETLNEGGFLITTDASVEADAASLVLYQKRQGRLEPVLFRNVEYNLQHTIALTGRGWTVTQAESLLMDVSENRFSDSFELLYNPTELKRGYGLEKEDVVFDRIRGLDAVAAEPVLGPDQAGPDAGERSGNLFVSLRDSLTRQLLVLFLGLDLSLWIAPQASLQWLAPVWGLVAGLGLLITFAPRAYYWWSLRRDPPEVLTPGTVGGHEHLIGLLNTLEANGWWPRGLEREALELGVLPDTPWSWRQLWSGVTLAQAEGVPGVRVRISLHPRFLALRTELQLVILLHELVHARGAGHLWATLAELTALWSVWRHGFRSAGVVSRQELDALRAAVTRLPLARTLSDKQWRGYPEPRPELDAVWAVVEVDRWADLPRALDRARQAGTRALDLVAVSIAETEPLTGTIALNVVVDQLYRLEQDTRQGRTLSLNDRPGLLTAMLRRDPDTPLVLAIGVSGPLCQPLASALAERLRERLPDVQVRGLVSQAYQWQTLAEQFRLEIPWREMGTEHGWRWVLNALGIVSRTEALQEPFETLIARVKDLAAERGQTDAEYLLAAMQAKADLMRQDPTAFSNWLKTQVPLFNFLPVGTRFGSENDPGAGLQFIYNVLFGTSVLAGRVRPRTEAPPASPGPAAPAVLSEAKPARADQGGNLYVSPLRAAALAAVAVAVGLIFGFALGPAALTTVSVWGAVSGLGLVFNYAPRLYYLFRLSRPHAPPLASATADAQLAGVFEALEAQGGLPAGYRRPTIEVLTGGLSAAVWRGVQVGRGEARADGPAVSLHANFLSLPAAVQLAVLRHEVYEAHGRGHARATLAEYGSYLKLGVRRSSAAANRFAALPHAVQPGWRVRFEGPVRTGDQRRLRAVTEQDRVLDEGLRRTLGSRITDLAGVEPEAKVRYLARGLFKRVYLAEIDVRFTDGETRTLTMALKVPRWSFLGPFLSTQLVRFRADLAGSPVLPAFGITSQGVIAETFVAGSAPRVDPEGEAAGRADPVVRRRLVALYIETLAGLRARRGARAFFFDPKPENVLMSAAPARTLTLIDHDLALTAPVAFGPFTDLVMLSAYYGTRPVAARLQRVFRGLLTPFLPFVSLVFAFFVRPDRQVFDGVLDALGPEAGRAYLERARRSRAGRLAAGSGFGKALAAYLDAVPSLSAPLDEGPWSGPVLALRDGRLGLRSGDPVLARWWEEMQTSEWDPVRQALTAHLRSGGDVRIGARGQGRLLGTEGNTWWLDPLLLAGRTERPGRPELSPAPPAVWVLLLSPRPQGAAAGGLYAGSEAVSPLLQASHRAGLLAGAEWLERYAGDRIPEVFRTAAADRTDRARAALWAEDLRWLATFADDTEGTTAPDTPSLGPRGLESLAQRLRETPPAAWLGDALGRETVLGGRIASWPVVRVDSAFALPAALSRLEQKGVSSRDPVLAVVVETLPASGEIRLILVGDTLGRLKEAAPAIPALRGLGLLRKVELVESLELRPGRPGRAAAVRLDALALPAALRDRGLSTVWFADLRARLAELMPGADLSASVIHPGAALSCVRSFDLDLSWTQSGRAEPDLGWETVLRLLEIPARGPEGAAPAGVVPEAITAAMLESGWAGSNHAEFLVRRVQDLAARLHGRPEDYRRLAEELGFGSARVPTVLPETLSGPEVPLRDLTTFLFEEVVGGLYLTGRLPGAEDQTPPADGPRTPPAAPGPGAPSAGRDPGVALTDAERLLRAWVEKRPEAEAVRAGQEAADPDLTDALAQQAVADPALTEALDRSGAPAGSAAWRAEWLKTAIEEALDERGLAAGTALAPDQGRDPGTLNAWVELRRRAAPALPALTGGGERRADAARATVRRGPHEHAGDGLLLAAAAIVLAGRRVLTLRRALARTRALPGPPLWLILRHTRFRTVAHGLLERVRGERREDGTADKTAVAAVQNSLRANPIFRVLFGSSARLGPLGGELVGLDREAEGLGLIGWELAPELYVREALDARLRQDGISAPVRASLLDRLWAQPAWSKHLARLQSAALAGRQDGPEVSRLRVLRHQRRLLMLLLAELDRPEGTREDQEAVLRALSVFAPDRPVRVRLARPAEQGIAYTQYQLPELVLTHPLLRSRLLALFVVYDDSGLQLRPADPVLRTVAGSA